MKMPPGTRTPEADARRKERSRLRNNKSGMGVRQAKNIEEIKQLNIHVPRGTRMTVESRETLKLLHKYFNEIDDNLINKALNYKHLTKRTIEFARHYALLGRRQRAKAAALAGYSTNTQYRHLEAMATQILQRPYMDDLITAFEIREKRKMLITVEDVVKWFNEIATKSMEAGDFANANRAMENLGKYLGMFIDKKETTVRHVHSKQDLDDEIARLTAILDSSKDEIERNIRIN